MFATTARKSQLIGIAIAGVLLSMLLLNSNVFADRTKPPAKSLTEEKAARKEYQQAIRQMEKHIAIENGLLVLKVKRGADIGMDQGIFDELAGALEGTNDQIKAGVIKIEEIVLQSEFAGEPAEAEDHAHKDGHKH